MIKSRLNVTHDIAAARSAVKILRASGSKIGLVPTMGALHEGHISLIHKAKELADEVVVSIFVNPTQFGPDEDFATYPRTLQRDIEICEKHGVAVVFQPEINEMYSGNEDLIRIRAGELAGEMCGKSRPGHFDGVLQIVNKLFNIIEPDLAVFGQKDIQQFYIIRQMVRDFKMNLDIVMAPVQREADGLAISSRNVHLRGKDRKNAPFLYQALENIHKAIQKGDNEITGVIESWSAWLEQKGLKIDYITCAEPPLLQPVSRLEKGKNYILAGAVLAGEIRLIDNLIIQT